jgi:hypothetical protein
LNRLYHPVRRLGIHGEESSTLKSDLTPGSSVRIPCRRCGTFMPVAIHTGTLALSCGHCKARTEVRIAQEGKLWRVRTSLLD